MGEKKWFWIFLIVGVFWLLGVSYCYTAGISFDIGKIQGDKIFSSKDSLAVSPAGGIAFFVVSLLIFGVLWFFSGLFLGRKAEDELQNALSENRKFKEEIARQTETIEKMKILYTGGKITRKDNLEKSSQDVVIAEKSEEFYDKKPNVILEEPKVIEEPVVERHDTILEELNIGEEPKTIEEPIVEKYNTILEELNIGGEPKTIEEPIVEKNTIFEELNIGEEPEVVEEPLVLQEEEVVTQPFERYENVQEKDDLKVIEGISEKIECILNENRIFTWKQVSETPAGYLKNLLIAFGGAGYKIHDTTSWVEQAKLASEGKWEELEKLHQKLRENK